MASGTQSATGASLSLIVIVKLQTTTFPPASVAVYSTVFIPSGKTLPLANPPVCTTTTLQLSTATASAKLTIAPHIPKSVSATTSAGHANKGGILSSTVTMATQVFELPFTSVTVRVTLFNPISAQVNEDMSIDILAIPQASFEPPSTSATTILAFPSKSNCTVTF